MLSILIPVYNFDISRLVNNLNDLAYTADIDFEIIIIDDASEEEFKIKNRTLDKLDKVKYIEEAQNLGRSRIRNKLADMASFQYLLFIDCDSAISGKDYIKNYITKYH